jgi:hypothetical protein
MRIVIFAAIVAATAASTTVIPRPPRFLRHPGVEETTLSLVAVAAPELTAATPSDQPKQIPPPPAPRDHLRLRATTPGYEAAPHHLRLLWADETQQAVLPLYTPQPTRPLFD